DLADAQEPLDDCRDELGREAEARGRLRLDVARTNPDGWGASVDAPPVAAADARLGRQRPDVGAEKSAVLVLGVPAQADWQSAVLALAGRSAVPCKPGVARSAGRSSADLVLVDEAAAQKQLGARFAPRKPPEARLPPGSDLLAHSSPGELQPEALPVQPELLAARPTAPDLPVSAEWQGVR